MIKVGDNYDEAFHVTPKKVYDFAEVSGDKNPIHLDADFAAKSIFKKPIAHGILIGSFISKVLGNNFPGYGTIYLKQEFNFLAPIYVGDTVNVKVEVIEKKESKPIYKISTTCFVENKEVINGYALVKFES